MEKHLKLMMRGHQNARGSNILNVAIISATLETLRISSC
ncbi:hypothetical protein SynBIOSE41_03680 [Synechococcus sp. BIOS-E4-1]|nr:hypothetical protein SynBIOSE41_03680 [Synechococcus sp. BIOS-E4-1]